MSVTESVFFETFGSAVDSLIHRWTEEERRRLRGPNSAPGRFELFRSAEDPKARWIDGTPENVLGIFGLTLLFPESKFIHLARDVESVVRSLVHFDSIGGVTHSVSSAYHEWQAAVKACLEAERALGSERVIRVRYEDLVAQPERTLRACLSFIGEAWCDECLEPLSQQINQSRVPASASIPLDGVDSELIQEARRLSEILAEPFDAHATGDPIALSRLGDSFREATQADEIAAATSDLVRVAVPRLSQLWVVTGGSDELLSELQLAGMHASHFPCDSGGAHLGRNPENGAEALDLVRKIAFRGGFLVVPKPALWWLETYPELADALTASRALVVADYDVAAVFDLRTLLREDQHLEWGKNGDYAERLSDLVSRAVWPGASVAVASLGRADLERLPVARVVDLATSLGPASDRAAIDKALEDLRRGGVDFAVIPSVSNVWLGQRPALRQALDRRHDLVLTEPGVGSVYSLREADRPETAVPSASLPPESRAWRRAAEVVLSRLDSEAGLREVGDLIGSLVWRSAARGRLRDLFLAAQEAGAHVTPVHFYFPVPDTRKLDERFWEQHSELRGLDLDDKPQIALLQDAFPRFAEEYSKIPVAPGPDDDSFHLSNDMFGGTDALALYCMIRHFQPDLMIEVGSGQSTRLAAEAALRNGNTRLISIEPFPSDQLRAGLPGLSKLIEQPVQDVDLATFETLGENDILLIDSSHIVNIGSDVVHLFLEVLPRLNPGVIVHIHDIYFPHPYRREWVMDDLRFWNEQYLLQAFLAFNSEFEILLSNSLLGERHPEVLKSTFPTSPWWGGGSLWMRRRSEPGSRRPMRNKRNEGDAERPA